MILAKLFPGFFSQNIQHYEAFSRYFTEESTKLGGQKYTMPSDTTSWDGLFRQIMSNGKVSTPGLRFF